MVAPPSPNGCNKARVNFPVLLCGSACTKPLRPRTTVTSAGTVKVLTYNLFWWNLYGQRDGNLGSASKVIADAAPDVMGFQECEDVTRVLNEGGMGETHAAVVGPYAIAMAYRTSDWELLGKGDQDVAEDEQEQYYGKRAVQWMRLRRVGDGKVIFFANHHGPLRLNSGGRSGGAKTSANIAAVISSNSQPGDAIVLVGDFNADPTSETIKSLQGTYPRAFTGTSFNGVDHFFTPLEVVSKQNLGNGGSDHDALACVFQIA